MRVGPADAQERFRLLFEEQWQPVYRYARRRVEESAAADVAADVFAVAWRRLDEVPPDALPWLYGVARRVVANHRRSVERSDRLVARVGGVLIASGGHVETDALTSVTDQMTFAAAFQRLPEPDREVLGLIVWEGLDARRTAAVLGCGVGAVTMRLTRARRRLRALLDEEEGDD